MKYFALVLVILVCGLIYVRQEQPALWNQGLVALKVPEESGTNGASGVAPQNAATAADTTPAATPPASPGRSSTPEIISPDSVHINPDHVHAVAQPGEAAPAAETNAPATNAPGTPQAFVAPYPIPAQANWTWTVAGKDYENVVIQKVEADCVTIIYDGGGARLDISTLSPDLQKVLNYDPKFAAEAAAARKKDEDASANALLQEREQAAKLSQKNVLEAEANTSQMLLDAKKKMDALDAQARVYQAQQDLAVYRDDLTHLTGRVVIPSYGPSVGLPTGDPYYVKKYEDDMAGIQHCNEIIAKNGR